MLSLRKLKRLQFDKLHQIHIQLRKEIDGRSEGLRDSGHNWVGSCYCDSLGHVKGRNVDVVV